MGVCLTDTLAKLVKLLDALKPLKKITKAKYGVDDDYREATGTVSLVPLNKQVKVKVVLDGITYTCTDVVGGGDGTLVMVDAAKQKFTYAANLSVAWGFSLSGFNAWAKYTVTYGTNVVIAHAETKPLKLSLGKIISLFGL